MISAFLLVLATAVSSCPTCHFPQHSWNTVPAFFHSSQHSSPANDGTFTEAALTTIAKFPMVTIEKWQGDEVEPYMYEDVAMINAARQVKAKSPNTTVVVWFDSFRIYTADYALNPDINSNCGDGHFRPAAFLETGGHPSRKTGDPTSIYLLKNTSGLPALEPWSGCHIFDHTQQLARDYWTGMCFNMTLSGVVDGCGADASWQNGWDQKADWHLSDSTASAWRDGHAQMMRQTTAALQPGGILLGKQPYEIGDYVNGALHEGCDPSNETIITLMNLTAQAFDKPTVYQCHTTEFSIDSLAAFLIGAGPGHYYGTGGWMETESDDMSSHRPVEFDKALGDPLGAGMYDGYSTWTRSFASGTKVMFNAKTQKGTINWSK